MYVVHQVGRAEGVQNMGQLLSGNLDFSETVVFNVEVGSVVISRGPVNLAEFPQLN